MNGEPRSPVLSDPRRTFTQAARRQSTTSPRFPKGVTALSSTKTAWTIRAGGGRDSARGPWGYATRQSIQNPFNGDSRS